ncbi:hypothetical protein ACWIID_05915 [Streptomyces phaeochromogenes]
MSLKSLIAEATHQGKTDLCLDSTITRAHHAAAGMHIGNEAMDALEEDARRRSQSSSRATGGTGRFDFRHPGNEQVLLNTDGPVKSVKPIPHHYARTVSSGSTHTPYPAYVQDLKAQNIIDSSSTFLALPIAVGAGLLTSGTTTTVEPDGPVQVQAGTVCLCSS